MRSASASFPIPSDATKATHGTERERFKQCVLGVQYGIGKDALADRIGQSPSHAQSLLDAHRRTYSAFWSWSDSAVNFAMLHGSLHTVFGWRLRVTPDTKPRTLRNFPMQANGADMLRVACSFACERGIRICAPVHDAVLIEAPMEEIDAAVAGMRGAMADASRIVLDGFELRTDAKVFREGQRFQEERGRRMWTRVAELLGVREVAA